MEIATTVLAELAGSKLLRRNEVSSSFFPQQATRLAQTCREMAARFEAGGRLLAFGRGAYSTDAQHVSVEFVHPVIVGKRALPALDVTSYLEGRLYGHVGASDIVMGFGPPGGDREVEAELARLQDIGALTIALPGQTGSYACSEISDDPFIHQELIEVLYHTLWETVHVFFEHREMGHDVGESGFLYPFLGSTRQNTEGIVSQVADSITEKALEVERLRKRAADSSSVQIARAAAAMRSRLDAGGRILTFGNGGSATDANDFAYDCTVPPIDIEPMPAVSLSLEPAHITAIGNDVGMEATFLRLLIAHATQKDIAVAFSTSGGSANVIAALQEARKRGLLTVAFLGYDGGEILRRELADVALVVPSDHIPRIQEVHASMYHVLIELLGTPGI